MTTPTTPTGRKPLFKLATPTEDEPTLADNALRMKLRQMRDETTLLRARVATLEKRIAQSTTATTKKG